jgi:hypothetical protein
MFRYAHGDRDMIILRHNTEAAEKDNVVAEYEMTLRWAIDFICAHKLSGEDEYRIQHLIQLLDEI